MNNTIKYFEELGIIESLKFSKGTKVDIICRVDGLRNTIDRMSDREPSSQCRSIFHIIDPISPSARLHALGFLQQRRGM